MTVVEVNGRKYVPFDHVKRMQEVERKKFLKCIEDIKAEITSKAPRHFDGEIAKKSCWFSLDEVFEIIDKKVNEVTDEQRNSDGYNSRN